MDVSIVDEALKADLEWRRILAEIQELKHKHNVISREVSRLQGPEREEKIRGAKELLSLIEVYEKKLSEVEAGREEILPRLPNIVHESVPIGPDGSYNVLIRFYGRPRVWTGFLEKEHRLG